MVRCGVALGRQTVWPEGATPTTARRAKMPPMTKTTGARAAVAAGAGGIASATLVIRLAYLWCTMAEDWVRPTGERQICPPRRH